MSIFKYPDNFSASNLTDLTEQYEGVSWHLLGRVANPEIKVIVFTQKWDQNLPFVLSIIISHKKYRKYSSGAQPFSAKGHLSIF